MAAYTSLLLVIALCAATAHALRCYTCTGASSNSNCMTATNCTLGETSCMTSVGSVSFAGISATSITKTCAASCTPTASTSFVVGSASVSCCSTDLCNTSGGASIKSSYAAILLALGSVLMILKSSVL